MAKQFTKLFFCFFTLRFPGVIFSVSVGEEGMTVTQEKAPQSREWWNQAPPKRKDQPIGQNVSLRAHIFYDSEYLKRRSQREIIQSRDAENGEDLKGYFQSLFREKSFRSQEPSLSEFDAKGSLENLTKYGATLMQPNNTIFYYYTWEENRFKTANTENANGVEYSGADVETNRTFCTDKTSGAVIRHRHGGLVHWATARATLFVFGSQHFLWFTDEDWKNMTDVFSKCPKDLPTPLPPAC
uniref:28 kDa Metastriate family member n=1 Tax=Rhipicephalus appendiculatus TaxID=34631 RepID=A0A131Z5A6_RHIAP